MGQSKYFHKESRFFFSAKKGRYHCNRQSIHWKLYMLILTEKRLVRLCTFLDISSLCNLQSMVSQTVILATNYEENIANQLNDIG